MKNIKYFSIAIILFNFISKIEAQTYWSKIEEKKSTLGIAEVYQKFKTPDFQLKLVKASQTVAALRPQQPVNVLRLNL